jgi:hypothetical protein
VPPDDPGNPTVDYRGEKRSNETHESKSDPETKMARKGAGKEGKLSYRENLLVKNRNGLIVDSRVWESTGRHCVIPSFIREIFAVALHI